MGKLRTPRRAIIIRRTASRSVPHIIASVDHQFVRKAAAKHVAPRDLGEPGGEEKYSPVPATSVTRRLVPAQYIHTSPLLKPFCLVFAVDSHPCTNYCMYVSPLLFHPTTPLPSASPSHRTPAIILRPPFPSQGALNSPDQGCISPHARPHQCRPRSESLTSRPSPLPGHQATATLL